MSTGDPTNGQQRTGYDAQDITVLEGLEAVRKRPGMYIGSTGVRGLHHLVYEVVDNSVDEALAGYCDTVSVTIHPDNSVTVADNGRGIPVAKMEKEGKSALEVVLTVLHAGGKFGEGGGYKVSGGLHGVGVSVVNALSDELTVVVKRDGYTWTQSYVRGVPQGAIEQGEPTDETGTTITFRPDDEVFETLDVRVLDARAAPARDGVPDARPADLDHRRARRGRRGNASSTTRAGSRTSSATSTRTRTRSSRRSSSSRARATRARVEVAMQWNGTYQESVFSFANNINTHEGGSHLSGFRSALTRTINRYAREQGLLKEKDKDLEGEDIREGLTAVISAKLTDPQFEGQTKTKLGNPGMQGFVESVVNAKLAEFLEENPKEAERVVRKAVDAAQRPRRGPQGARHRAQVGHGRHGPARQARRLHGQGARDLRDLHRRGRLRRRFGQAGPRPLDAGRAAAARQDPQRREVAHRQGAAERRDPGADHRARHRHPRRVRHREAALPQDHPDDGRRRRRRPHPHADPHAAVPRDAGPGRGRPHLHRQAAALQGHAGQAASSYIEKESELEAILLGDKLERFEITDNDGKAFKLTDVRWQRYCRLLKQYEGWSSALRAEHGHEVVQFLEESQILDNADQDAGGAARAARARRSSDTEPLITELRLRATRT